MPRKFGDYHLDRLIGKGSFGSVYVAHDSSGDKFAIKLLSKEVARERPKVNRFLKDARRVAQINHPNIIRVQEAGRLESEVYIVSELVGGQTLRDEIERGYIDFPRMIDIAIQVASALDAAHEFGVVHRDMKPENIILSKHGAKITDFGISRLFPPHGRTERGITIGPASTVPYMSPEQLSGQPVDQRTDIWSLGVMIGEMVARRTPFEQNTVADTVSAILRDPPASLNVKAPSKFQEIFHRALQKNPDDRYSTAGDVAVDLKDMRNELTSGDKSGGNMEDSSSTWVSNVADRYNIVLGRGSVVVGGSKAIAHSTNVMKSPSEAPVKELPLFINLWLEDFGENRVPGPFQLKLDESYRFMFAIENWTREDGASAPFEEPPSLRKSKTTKVVIELHCRFLVTTENNGYVRREVDYRAGIGFPPETFELKATSEGRFFLTARLLKSGETVYRDLLELDVKGPAKHLVHQESHSVPAYA